MDNERTEKIRQRVLGLISAEYESDAAFERDMDLKEKTVLSSPAVKGHRSRNPLSAS